MQDLDVHRLVVVHINTNSVRNKFDLLSEQIPRNVDMLMICETKTEDSFPNVQFQILPFRFDRDKNVGSIMIFIREDIPTKLLLIDKSNERLIRTKWLINYCYNLHRSRITSHLQFLSKKLDLYSSDFGNAIVLRDFSATLE